MLAAKRPDIQIVGDEVHPLLKVTDFAPYIAKIKASGADTVITGNWGQDFALLLKAAADSGLKVELVHLLRRRHRRPDRHQAGQSQPSGVPGRRGLRECRSTRPSREFEKALRAKYDFSLFYPRAVNEMRMLARPREKSKSLDPVKVAAALEGMEFEVFNGGKGVMRKDDHQFFQPIYIASLGRAHRQGAVRRGKDRLGLEAGRQDRHAANHASDHLQDGPAELTFTRRSSRPEYSGRMRP